MARPSIRFIAHGTAGTPPGRIASNRTALAERVGLTATASNDEILAALDVKLAAAKTAKAQRAAVSADDALYALAFGEKSASTDDGPEDDLYALAFGTGGSR